MATILHRIGIKTDSINDVFKAISTIEGLKGWWTTATNGVADQVGGDLQFRFGAGGFDMKVRSLEAPRFISWEVTALEKEWIGTTIEWQLKKEGDYIIVLFKHDGWRAATEFMHHCSTKWAIFLMSLKSLVETGVGAPSPDDTKVDNWN
ncbi:SRPBCC domain-containing protein [Flavihumibacter sp. CACIAM 22H1]|uniref:SRPBCC family protein n=1 Tax=Flavihumibacter sp. CACIAM 22H1 TaxID=1812911 RepID=UPI0007A8F9FD|nr:SRPBCC domain-containing protein [Flavihumibacter sp. CACIAM 22H1]KYP14216.1 MAG: polyketide cyclase [Flavihumibacter sp. CACIAM 22H1]